MNTDNVISYETFANALANRSVNAMQDKATALYILAYEVSQTQAHIATASLEAHVMAEQYTPALPDEQIDCMVRATTALVEAMRLVAIAADSLERAGQSLEVGTHPETEWPDLPA